MELQFAGIAVGALALVWTGDIDHVTQQVAHHALRDGATEMGAETEPKTLDVLLRVPIDWKSPQEHQATPVFDLAPPFADIVGDGGEREIVAADILQRNASAGIEMRQYVNDVPEPEPPGDFEKDA